MYLPVLILSLFNQSTLDDIQCRKILGDLLPKMASSGPSRAMSFRLEGENKSNGFFSKYSGTFKYLKDDKIKSELMLWRDDALVQRVVADGIKVWGYNALRNEYTVARYSPEWTQGSDYLKKYVSAAKYPVLGMGQHLMTLADQVGFTSSSLKDWIGGIAWQGKDEVDSENTLRIVRRIYQLVADYRYVMWELESFDEGVSFNFHRIKIYNENFDGSSSLTYLYLDEKIGAGYSGFKFTPKNGSKVLWIKD